MEPSKIKSPEEFYGFKMGEDRKLARWDKIVEYFKHLDESSPYIKVMEIGKTTMGNPFLLAIISSPENLRNLDRIREISYRIAHPDNLSDNEVNRLIQEGKVVVAMSMSLHASEVGGTQMVSELAYELVTRNDPVVQKIRENTVLLLFPCFNPDGNIMIVDWYNKYLGTEYEGCPLPYLYHKYVGHDNNRDAYALTQVESKLFSKVIYSWYPQAYVDFHQMGSYGSRFSVPPHCDPIYEEIDPLVWVEEQLYGAMIEVKLEAAGKTGYESQCTYTSYPANCWEDSLCYHNITGMLTEAASVKIATPMYIHPHQLDMPTRGRPIYKKQINFPHPWPGGWWRLRDIVEEQKIAAMAVLETAANFKEQILRNMYLKAKRQIELGKTTPPYAFIVSPEQHDPLLVYKLLETLQATDIKIHRASAEFKVDGAIYPKGTYVIFTSQPCRPWILKLLRRTFYPDTPWTRKPDGTPIPPYDLATDTIAEFMGVKLIEVSSPIKGEFETVDVIKPPDGGIEGQSQHGYLLDGRLNESFAAAMNLLRKGIEVYRVVESVEDLPAGAFYIPSKDEIINELREVAKQHHVTFKPASSEDFEKKPIKKARIGIYKRYWGGNIDEGWLRWVLEQYGFEYKSIMDEEIKKGGLINNYDIIILPNDHKSFIIGEGIEEYIRKIMPKFVLPKYPPEYKSGIGKEGTEKLQEFVKAGGTLITLGGASEYVIEEFKLPIRNVVKDLKPKEFLCPGSTLKVNVDVNHPIGYGMPRESLILFRQRYPVFELLYSAREEDYSVVVNYPEENILQSGWLIGEKYLSKKAALIDAKYSKGRIILFGFSPHFRGTTNATFKLLFNSLLLS